MNKTINQLEAVLQEITDYFAGIPQISVSPGEGRPPEQYTVTYQIKGMCKEEDGEVYPCDNHVVSLWLPFAFPQFPPNCRPESPTFHPDFDSSAICIGDFWEADQSIIKLILHIGHMISGENYSVINPFNEEAVEWYQENSDRLPFDTGKFDQTSAPASPALSETTEEEAEEEEREILDDDFGEVLSLAREEEPPSHPAVIDTDLLRLMARERRFQALSQELQATHTHFNGREELEEQTHKAMDTATALYREADDLEHQGEPKKAMEQYRAVGELVSDYPLLQEAKERVQQSINLSGDQGTEETEDEENEPLSSEPTSSPEEKRTFYEEEKKAAPGSRWLLYAIGGGSVALLATIALAYFSLGSDLEKAEHTFAECRSLLDAKKFKGAEQKCEEALNLLANVRLIKKDEKKQLKQKIRTLLESETLQQGRAGNTLLDGKFVSQSTKKLILAFNEAKTTGDTSFQQNIWQEAIAGYETALEAAAKTSAIDPTLLVEVRKQLTQARFNARMQAGEKSLSISDWNGAAAHFAKALQLAKANPDVSQEDIAQLELLSNQAKFNSLQNQGRDSFNNKDWLSALESYQHALEMVTKMDLSESDTISTLHANIARTKIYMTVEKGKEAFAAARWDDAITQYGQATLLLEENNKLLSQMNTAESLEKLSRIMLHASIIRDKQDVAKYLKEEEYGPALAKLQDIKNAITVSQFAEQSEFQVILQEISSQMKDADKQLLIIEKKTYLNDNFETLFLKHYPAAARSVLSSPNVEYLKKIENKLLFRMQCTEQSGGRPLRLQMDYLYSPASGQWQFYSEAE